MITLFTGSPGAGKTLSLVDFLSKLPNDRPLYVDGLEGLTLPHTEVDANNWHTELPDGAILVIDEAQRVWRPRGSGAKVPDSVAALETHRHHGIDVYLTTQAPALIDANVRNLVGRHVHIRDTGIMGRYWYEWPEVSTGMVWKTCINKKRLHLPKKAFDLYKSSSLHVTPVRGVPRLLIIVILLLIMSVALIYGATTALKKRLTPVSAPVATNTNTGPMSSSMRPSGASPADPQNFVPRIPGQPDTAPAYDGLKVVVSMPRTTAAICVNERCKCYTAQGTNTGLTSLQCKDWIDNPPFNPYQPDPSGTASGDTKALPRPAPVQSAEYSTSGAASALPPPTRSPV